MNRSVDAVKESLQSFGWSDYTIFVVMLSGCTGIGVYFNLRKRKTTEPNSEAQDYLLGGQTLGLFPISMSLIASAFTGVGFLGAATEVYFYGSAFVYNTIGMFSVGFALQFLILPVFHEMKLVSIFEYFDRRFKSRLLRTLGSLMYLLSAVKLIQNRFFFLDLICSVLVFQDGGYSLYCSN